MVPDLRDMPAALAKYKFYHRIEVAPGLITEGWEAPVGSQQLVLDEINKRDFTGKRVLDVGCRDGLFCFAAEKRGARYVLGIDNDLSPGAVELLIPWFKSKVEMRSVNVYDFASEEKFDVVIFPGTLYHLRFPFLGLKRLADALCEGGEIIIETAMYWAHHDEALLHCPAPKDSPYKEPTSVTFFNHLGLVGALESFGFADIECTSVLTPHANRFHSFEAYRNNPASKDVCIGRGAYVATYMPRPTDATRSRDTYWYGNHQANSTVVEQARMLGVELKPT